MFWLGHGIKVLFFWKDDSGDNKRSARLKLGALVGRSRGAQTRDGKDLTWFKAMKMRKYKKMLQSSFWLDGSGGITGHAGSRREVEGEILRLTSHELSLKFMEPQP